MFPIENTQYFELYDFPNNHFSIEIEYFLIGTIFDYSIGIGFLPLKF